MPELSKEDLRALSRDEKDLVEQTGKKIGKLAEKDLDDLIGLLRRARNRARDIGNRQAREARGKARPAGATPATGNAGTKAKTEVLAEALARAQAEQKRRRKEAARAEKQAAKDAAKAAKKAEKDVAKAKKKAGAEASAKKTAAKKASAKKAAKEKPEKEKPAKEKPAKEKPAKETAKAKKPQSQKQLAQKAMELKESAPEPDYPTDQTAGKGFQKLAPHKDQAPSGALDHAGELPSRERSRHRQTRAEQT